jgi:hypothetical protein
MNNHDDYSCLSKFAPYIHIWNVSRLNTTDWKIGFQDAIDGGSFCDGGSFLALEDDFIALYPGVSVFITIPIRSLLRFYVRPLLRFYAITLISFLATAVVTEYCIWQTNSSYSSLSILRSVIETPDYVTQEPAEFVTSIDIHIEYGSPSGKRWVQTVVSAP